MVRHVIRHTVLLWTQKEEKEEEEKEEEEKEEEERPSLLPAHIEARRRFWYELTMKSQKNYSLN